jgi:hypothetical protein
MQQYNNCETVQWNNSISETVRKEAHVYTQFLTWSERYYNIPEYWTLLLEYAVYLMMVLCDCNTSLNLHKRMNWRLIRPIICDAHLWRLCVCVYIYIYIYISYVFGNGYCKQRNAVRVKVIIKQSVWEGIENSKCGVSYRNRAVSSRPQLKAET